MAITGMALPISFLSYHIQNIVNDYIAKSESWEWKIKAISDYCEGSKGGMIAEITVFFIALLVYITVRGHTDVETRKDIRAIQTTLEDRLPLKGELISILKDIRDKLGGEMNKSEAEEKYLEKCKLLEQAEKKHWDIIKPYLILNPQGDTINTKQFNEGYTKIVEVSEELEKALQEHREAMEQLGKAYGK